MQRFVLLFSALLMFSMTINAQKSKLKVGKKAPEFNVSTLTKESVTLEDLLKNNDYIVVHFFIGSWHKYDKQYLTNLQSIYPKLQEKKVEIIAFTRDKPVYLKKLVDEAQLEYHIGLDPDWLVMSTYSVATKITPNYIPLKHKEYSTLNTKHTGSKDDMIPVCATYLINKEGKITWFHFDQDYRRRPDVNEILNQL